MVRSKYRPASPRSPRPTLVARRPRAPPEAATAPLQTRRTPGTEDITNYFKGKLAASNAILIDTKDTVALLRRAEVDVKETKSPVKDVNCKNNSNISSPHRIQLSLPETRQEVVVTNLQYNKTAKRGAASTKDSNKTATNNHKLTDYFPVRRSARKTKQSVLEERQRTFEKLLRNCIEDGLTVRHFPNKGRGVVTTKPFSRGDFVVEYSGELLDLAKAREREAWYTQDCNAGCYMYYFKHGNQQYCIDATAETGRLGRLVNHSRNGNLITKTFVVDRRPRLVLIAKEYIGVGVEVTYDYGDRSKESLKNHPWLAY